MHNCYCGKPVKRDRDKTCSRACYLRKRFGGHEAIYKTCICGTVFKTYPCRLKIGSGNYCSRKCFEANFKKRTGFTYTCKVVNKGWFKYTGNYHCQKEAYQALHIWIRRHKQYPNTCQHCHQPKRLDWANLSGEYKRDVNDWAALCRQCHYNFDKKGMPLCLSVSLALFI